MNPVLPAASALVLGLVAASLLPADNLEGTVSSAPATATAPATQISTALLPLGHPLLPRVIYTEVTLREKPETIKGDLLTFDETTLTIKRAKDATVLKWTDLTSASAFTLRSRLIDKTNAQHWLALGTFAWGMNAREQAKTALTKAATMNPALKPEVDATLKSTPGHLIAPPEKFAQSTPGGSTSPGSSKKDKPSNSGELFPDVKGK